ncbi:MAG: hypothetical protein KC609_17210, partial [Myxococcales bacterium]|nr:hypothetical protein [Myxococcales bacterium]
MAQLKRIVCYAVNGSGLGHVTRLMAVARWIKRYVTFIEGRAPEVLFLTSTEATNVLAQNGFLAYKIPSKTLVKQNDFDPLEYRRLSKAFIWQVLGTFRPDLLVVDTFPAGSFNELFQILDGPFRKGFIFRHVKPEFARRPTFSAALRLYDVLAVPHRPEAAPVAHDGVATPLCCCGEVVGFDRHDALDRETARAELGVPEGDKLLYVSAGGGGDPESERIVRHFVSALESVEGLHLLVGAGPLYRGRQLGGPRLTWSSGPNVARYFPGCDAAISAGGYNTVHELMLFGVPSLLFAQEKIADDQAARIDALAALGAAIRIRDVDDGLALRRLVERALDPTEQRRLRQGARAYMPTNGAARCARALLTSSYDERQLGWAAECLSEPLVAQAERLGSAASVFYGQWLPRLLPAARAEGLESHPR